MRRKTGQPVKATAFQRGQSGRSNCPFPLVSVYNWAGHIIGRSAVEEVEAEYHSMMLKKAKMQSYKLFLFGVSYISETLLNL